MRVTIAAIGLLALVSTPATAQKLGKGGIGIDENTKVPRCGRSLGTIALVEERRPGNATPACGTAPNEKPTTL